MTYLTSTTSSLITSSSINRGSSSSSHWSGSGSVSSSKSCYCSSSFKLLFLFLSFFDLLFSFPLLLLAELLHEAVNEMFHGNDPVLVSDHLPALWAGPEVAPGPAGAVLPPGQAEPAVGVAAVERHGTDEQIQTSGTLIFSFQHLR